MGFAEFRERWRDEIKPAFHYNPELHAETVTYTPVGGTSRQINVHIVDQGSLDVEQIDTSTVQEEITVKTFKNATTGIDKPNEGDTIVRQAPHDLDPRPFVYQGDDENQGRDDWRLTFKRKRRTSQGFTE